MFVKNKNKKTILSIIILVKNVSKKSKIVQNVKNNLQLEMDMIFAITIVLLAKSFFVNLVQKILINVLIVKNNFDRSI